MPRVWWTRFEQRLVPTALLPAGNREGIRPMTTVAAALADPTHVPDGEHVKRNEKIRVHSAASDVRTTRTTGNLSWHGNALLNFSLTGDIEIGSTANFPSVQQTGAEL
jgi:hypothetical protein